MKRWLPATLALVLAGGGAALVLLLARSVPFGPLGPPPSHGSLCTPAENGRSYDGTYALQNRGERAVTVDDVRLVDARGLVMEGAYVTPIFNTTLIGTVPPETGTEGNRAWRERILAVGAAVPAGEDRNLVLVLRVGERKGSAKQIEVHYHDASGKRFRFLSAQEIAVVPPSDRC